MGGGNALSSLQDLSLSAVFSFQYSDFEAPLLSIPEPQAAIAFEEVALAR
jgi:hypothetical protein